MTFESAFDDQRSVLRSESVLAMEVEAAFS